MSSVSSAPPRTAERLLEALGAAASYRDAVLGDLAEEFALRAESHGADAARRWYRREALRAAPHLLRDWARQLRPRDVADLAGVVVVAHVFLWLLVTVIGVGVRALLLAFGLVVDARSFPGGGLLTIGVASCIGGYLAASLGSRARLPTVLVYGTTWSGIAAVVWATVDAPAPAWFRVAVPTTILLATLLGGGYRAARGIASPTGD